MFGKKFSKEPTEKQKIGKIGEDCACQYLEKNGYKVIERNYLKKWGEIDIVARREKKLYFVEVKTVSRVISETRDTVNFKDISDKNDSYRAEDNMHPWKLKRLARTIQSYLLDKDISDDVDWQFDVATVYLDMARKLSDVRILPDVVL